MVNFGLVNEVEAGYGRFSGAARIVGKYFQSDPDTLTPISDICGLKISDNGQKWSKMVKNGLFNVVLI